MNTWRRDKSWWVMVQSRVRGAGVYDASLLQACPLQAAGHFWAIRAAQTVSEHWLEQHVGSEAKALRSLL